MTPAIECRAMRRIRAPTRVGTYLSHMNGYQRLIAWAVGLLIPSIALVLSVSVATGTWERVRSKPKARSIKVTGSATQRIVSDLIEWSAEIDTLHPDRTQAYQNLKSHVDEARKYLEEHGIPAESIRISSVDSHEIFDTEWVTEGEQSFQRRVSRGWKTRQTLSVRSTDIEQVEKVSRAITELLETGVSISSHRPQYHYTKLGEVKIDMLAKASADARERAERIVKAAGGKGLGKLIAADMGVINVNVPNSSATSWEGNNDKTSLEKDIITIAHVRFELP